MAFKRYWLQGDYVGASEKEFKVYLKTNDLEKAIGRMKKIAKEVFIFDCLHRITIDANYDCKLYQK